MVEELVREVKAEVLKPFSVKLERAEKLCKLWAPRSGVKSVVSCSFGKDSMMVLYLVRQFAPRVPVVFENTGVEFPETIRFMKEITKKWDLNLHVVKPFKTYWQIMDENLALGRKIDDGSKWTNSCCYYMKEKPMRKFMWAGGYTHSITGVTAMESRRRMWVACEKGSEYYAKDDKFWKVHPIMFMKEDEVFRFIEEMGIPLNPVYEKYGLRRMGCVPCTAHKQWKETLSRTNPRMYKHIMEKYFGQKLLTSFQ